MRPAAPAAIGGAAEGAGAVVRLREVQPARRVHLDLSALAPDLTA
jgi:hypothetical protein